MNTSKAADLSRRNILKAATLAGAAGLPVAAQKSVDGGNPPRLSAALWGNLNANWYIGDLIINFQSGNSFSGTMHGHCCPK
jgi:hypothetical protein